MIDISSERKARIMEGNALRNTAGNALGDKGGKTVTAALAKEPDTNPVMGIVLAAALGAAMSLSLGTYAKLHEATGDKIFALGFPTLLAMKAWLATGAAVLALGQLTSALWMWGRLPLFGKAPAIVAPAHRWLGTVAFLFTLPVAYHCLWALGFRDTETRVLIHSLLGCAFYGVFVTKMLLLRSKRLPGWMLPAAGGSLVLILTGIWWTSSLWFFTTIGFPGL